MAVIGHLPPYLWLCVGQCCSISSLNRTPFGHFRDLNQLFSGQEMVHWCSLQATNTGDIGIGPCAMLMTYASTLKGHQHVTQGRICTSTMKHRRNSTKVSILKWSRLGGILSTLKPCCKVACQKSDLQNYTHFHHCYDYRLASSTGSALCDRTALGPVSIFEDTRTIT